jgi:hypothetical protein
MKREALSARAGVVHSVKIEAIVGSGSAAQFIYTFVEREVICS